MNPVRLVVKNLHSHLGSFLPLSSIVAFVTLFTLHHPPLAAAGDTTGTLSHEALFAPNKTFPYFETISQLDPTAPHTYSPANAAMLAQCSMLIYVKEPEFISEKLHLAGFTDIQYFDTAGTYAFLAESPDHIVIAFRGTETDYLTDSKFLHRDFTENGKAHAGFIDALAHVQTELQASLATRFEASPHKTVWLTGHSLGAALATLFTIQNADTVDALYAIGSPRVANLDLANHWHALLPIFRIVNNNDLITRLPAPIFYQHIGPTYFLTSEGELITDPPKTRIWRDRLKGHGNYTKKLFQEHWTQADFRTIPTESFADHSPRLYTEALIKLAIDQSKASTE